MRRQHPMTTAAVAASPPHRCAARRDRRDARRRGRRLSRLRPHQGELSPCDAIFQETSLGLSTRVSFLRTEGELRIGREQLTELSERAQMSALNLKTCCTVLDAGRSTPSSSSSARAARAPTRRASTGSPLWFGRPRCSRLRPDGPVQPRLDHDRLRGGRQGGWRAVGDRHRSLASSSASRQRSRRPRRSRARSTSRWWRCARTTRCRPAGRRRRAT